MENKTKIFLFLVLNILNNNDKIENSDKTKGGYITNVMWPPILAYHIVCNESLKEYTIVLFRSVG